MTSDPNFGFIAAAYAVAAVILAVMIGGVALEGFLLRRKLRRLEGKAGLAAGAEGR